MLSKEDFCIRYVCYPRKGKKVLRKWCGLTLLMICLLFASAHTLHTFAHRCWTILFSIFGGNVFVENSNLLVMYAYTHKFYLKPSLFSLFASLFLFTRVLYIHMCLLVPYLTRLHPANRWRWPEFIKIHEWMSVNFVIDSIPHIAAYCLIHMCACCSYVNFYFLYQISYTTCTFVLSYHITGVYGCRGWHVYQHPFTYAFKSTWDERQKLFLWKWEGQIANEFNFSAQHSVGFVKTLFNQKQKHWENSEDLIQAKHRNQPK